MRLTHWALGIVLGSVVGGSSLAIGALALLVAVPALAWAASEKARPVGLGGLFAGAGVGAGGLFALADARCSAFNSAGEGFVQSCTSPDPTPYYTAAIVLILVGVLATVLALRRTSQSR